MLQARLLQLMFELLLLTLQFLLMLLGCLGCLHLFETLHGRE